MQKLTELQRDVDHAADLNRKSPNSSPQRRRHSPDLWERLPLVFVVHTVSRYDTTGSGRVIRRANQGP